MFYRNCRYLEVYNKYKGRWVGKDKVIGNGCGDRWREFKIKIKNVFA